MVEHPLKTAVTIFCGLGAGLHSLISSHHFFLDYPFDSDASVALAIAIGKAFLIGAAAWSGQTVAIWVREKIIHWWKNRNEK